MTLSSNWLRSPSGSTRGTLTPSRLCCGACHVCSPSHITSNKRVHAGVYVCANYTVCAYVFLCMCFSGCEEEPRCFLVDLQDAVASSFFSCRLHPDNRVCGAYDKPLRQACRHLLDRPPSNTYSKKGKHLGCNDSP